MVSKPLGETVLPIASVHVVQVCPLGYSAVQTERARGFSVVQVKSARFLCSSQTWRRKQAL